MLFYFRQKTEYEMRISDWSSDVCSSDLLDVEHRRAQRLGGDLPTRVLVGAMIEVPSLAWQLPALCSRVDFVSVGSNDLLQFLLAADRQNPRLSNRYEVLSPPLLSFLDRKSVV